VDYPKLEDLKQLTVPVGNVKDVSWSPDGQYLSFSSETDIYIVNVGSNP
jgi:Tol biopolymer transport system component